MGEVDYGTLNHTAAELRKLASSASVLAEHLGTSSGTLKPKHNTKLQSLTNNTLKVEHIKGTCLNAAVIKETKTKNDIL